MPLCNFLPAGRWGSEDGLKGYLINKNRFMLSINEIKVGKVVQINNEPYLVVRTDHHKMGRGGAVLKTKLKNLITGNVLDKTVQGNEKIEPANIERKKANFMYKDEESINFCIINFSSLFKSNNSALSGKDLLSKP